MGFDDQSIHDKAKRQEALTDTLKAHFSSLFMSIRQDLLDGVTPVIDNVTTTNAILHKGPDNEYRDGLVAFNHTAHNTIDAHRSLTEQFGELKDQSLTRLKSVVGLIETERARRAELYESFKAQYQEIRSRIRERLSRAAGEDLDRVATAIESRAQAVVNGKDKDKEKMRQKILKAFA
ncbi:hypothetical protein RSAG8_02307, partial [Rhizoctonia solani AG-8 WAC10335]